ncbi:hypothetical protein MXD81_58210 [Microbacteriaceae bacterium K1510]|nr:hypothetical protein [Microbacteriaceae bacterium K1510]
MKTITKIAAAAVFAVTAATSAFAGNVDPDAQQLQERNTYIYANGPTAPATHQQFSAHAYRGTESFAQAPYQTRDVNVQVRDFGAGSQS